MRVSRGLRWLQHVRVGVWCARPSERSGRREGKPKLHQRSEASLCLFQLSAAETRTVRSSSETACSMVSAAFARERERPARRASPTKPKPAPKAVATAAIAEGAL